MDLDNEELKVTKNRQAMELSKEKQEAIEYFDYQIELAKKEIEKHKEDEFKGIGTDEDIAKMRYCNLVEIKNLIEKLQKENDELKNHIHYKKCLACGNEFKAKRKDAKYCIYCSKFVANRNYYMNLTEEQKEKRREQAKLSMRKLRAKNE